MKDEIESSQTIQQQGNGLMVHIPAALAEAAHIAAGQRVTLQVISSGLAIHVGELPKLTLAQKLEAFDPERHGGELGLSTK